MKKTLTVLCLMIAVAGAGQSDSLTLKNDTTSFFALGSWYGGGVVTQIHEPKYDTIPIIYLYCDTAVLYRDSIGNREVEVGRRWFTYWDFGYEVRQETGMIPVTSSENSMMYDWLMSYKFIGYLDRQKNPIRKVAIIWITKIISND